ncbi:hypothetical protein C5167_036974 [Papaver somniferum]|uniref:Fatty acyl-CoA reductase n=1 Tax=Papaver somniferum TaxID=3469 RepID=A0A4Y7I551_PAPSO|nr:hypothetical protein C5167_036974 [Papaver somniferum]
MRTRLEELKSLQVSKSEETEAMENFGLERARAKDGQIHVFTKAMGEMLIGKYGGNLPIVIIRPTIITSTYKEPFPGWIKSASLIKWDL